jgi:hypothetical protein
LGAEIVKPTVLAVSLLCDLWAFVKDFIDTSRMARKTSMGAAAIRFTRSIAALTVFLLFISNLTCSILFLSVSAIASLYRDSYITHQNRLTIKNQKTVLKEEENRLKQYQEKGFDEQTQTQQKAIIQKQIESVDTSNNYHLKNKVKVGLDVISSIGSILVIVGMFFPPITFVISLVGLSFITVSAILKAIDKISNDGISRVINGSYQKMNGAKNDKKQTADTNTASQIKQASPLPVNQKQQPVEKEVKKETFYPHLPISHSYDDDSKRKIMPDSPPTCSTQNQLMSPFLIPGHSTRTKYEEEKSNHSGQLVPGPNTPCSVQRKIQPGVSEETRDGNPYKEITQKLTFHACRSTAITTSKKTSSNTDYIVISKSPIQPVVPEQNNPTLLLNASII